LSGWTDERVEALKKLHAEGRSASEMAKALGGTTRNACIGKCVRLGLGSIGGGRPSAPARLVYRPPTAPKAALPPGSGMVLPRLGSPSHPNPTENKLAGLRVNAEVRAEAATQAPLETGLRTLLTIKASECRWPLGDPQRADFTLCGRKVFDGRPYCVDCIRDRKPYVATPTRSELARSVRKYAA